MCNFVCVCMSSFAFKIFTHTQQYNGVLVGGFVFLLRIYFKYITLE